MSSRPGSAAARAHRAFPAFRYRGFQIQFTTYVLAMMADNIEHVISYWMLYQKFHSPALAGFAVLSHWLPFLMFSVAAGALADRFDPRRLIQMRHGAVHPGLARLGLFLHHRHPRGVARDGAAGDPRLRRRAVADPEPAAALRHRRPRRPDERGAAQRDGALCRRAGRPGHGRRHHARARPRARHPAQHGVLPAAGAVAGECALRAALPQGRGAAATRRARLRRHRPHHPRYRRVSDHHLDDLAGRPLVVLCRQRLQRADARLRPGSRPRRSRRLLQHAACRRRGRRNAGRLRARRPRLAAAQSAHGHHPGHALVRGAHRIRVRPKLSDGAGVPVRGRLLRALVQRNGADPGAGARAGQHARPRHRLVQHGEPRIARVQRRLGRDCSAA